MNQNVMIAMSGGVDSSVAAYLLKERGFACAGAMMKLRGGGAEGYGGKTRRPPDDASDARAIASRMDMPFYVFDFTDCFSERVIGRFARAYLNGLTPNPCIDCNRYLKFGRFLSKSNEIGMDRIATGHYAQTELDAAGGRYLLKKGADPDKDQSYVLYAMTQAQLARTIFPLGNLRKPEVREIALKQGFANAGKRESQDICFVPDGDYARFIAAYTGVGPEPGFFVDAGGNILGRHKGIAAYTVGQRRGLGIPAKTPLYVQAVDPRGNTVTVGEEKGLYSKTLLARDINLIPFDRLDAPMRVRAKIRYRQPEQPATVTQLDNDTLRVDFDSPQRAITKGQAVVLYDGDVVVGGGTIL